MPVVILADSAVVADAVCSAVQAFCDEATAVVLPVLQLEEGRVNLGRSLERLREVLMGLRLHSTGTWVVGIICPTRPMGSLNPIGEAPMFATFVACAILSFPEVKWFTWDGSRIVQNKDDSSGIDHGEGIPITSRVNVVRLWAEVNEYLAKWRTGAPPSLFDPEGLRAHLKQRIWEAMTGHGGVAGMPGNRNRAAVIVDDERDFALVGGFTLFRFGFRVTIVNSLHEMKRVFGKENERGQEYRAARWAIVLEDLYLGFPDREKDDSLSGEQQHLSVLETRYQQYPGLLDTESRVLVTIGPYKVSGGTGRKRGNYRALRRTGSPFKVIQKPVEGIFSLWEQCSGLLRDDYSVFRSWDRRALGVLDAAEGGHSAPGRLLRIAEGLIQRARQILSDSPTCLDKAVHAAVLSIEAKEILFGKTPMTAFDALKLQHEAEITAESLFLGVEKQGGLRSRFREIEKETTTLVRQLGKSRGRRTGLQVRLMVVEQLAKRFAELRQIDEELTCLAEARRLRFKFWACQKPLRRIMSPLLGYLSFSLSSLPRFILVVVGWALFFGLSYYGFSLITPGRPAGFWAAMAGAAKIFFTGEPSTAWANLGYGASPALETVWDFWLTFQGIIGLTNLGLLGSHLYLIISRR